MSSEPPKEAPKKVDPVDRLAKSLNIPHDEAKRVYEDFEQVVKEVVNLYLRHWSTIPMGGVCDVCRGLASTKPAKG